MVTIAIERGARLCLAEKVAPVADQRAEDPRGQADILEKISKKLALAGANGNTAVQWAEPKPDAPVFSSCRTKTDGALTSATPIPDRGLSHTAGASLLNSLGISYKGNSKVVVLVIEPENSAPEDTPFPDATTGTVLNEAHLQLKSDLSRDELGEIPMCPTVNTDEVEVNHLTEPTSEHLLKGPRAAPLLLTPAQRTDLVRPTRPTSKRLSQRPRSVPLYLTEKQRVDRTVDSVPLEIFAEKICPRRVTIGRSVWVPETSKTGVSIECRGLLRDEVFATFAEKMGATRLPDVVEAAAAHLCLVEGQSDFSRSELMARATPVATESGASPEALLRCFGSLQRKRKIHETERGRFLIASNTRFNPKLGRRKTS